MGSHRSVVDWTKQRSRTTSGVRVVWDIAGGHSVVVMEMKSFVNMFIVISESTVRHHFSWLGSGIQL